MTAFIRRLIILFGLVFCISHLSAANPDSTGGPLFVIGSPFYQQNLIKAKKDTVTPDMRRARITAIKSAIIPGWGQAVNHKYWKIPIIYAGFAGLVYSIKFNNDQFQGFRKSYIVKANHDTTSYDPYPNLPANQVQNLREYYRRNRDLSIIGSAVLYLLNIADAYVDAQLRTFNISDDLSFEFNPSIFPNIAGQKTSGSSITAKLTFKF